MDRKADIMQTPKETNAPITMEKVDGMNFIKTSFPVMFKHRMDDLRLKQGVDTLLATYPRTGTTWLSQIVSLMLMEEDQMEEVKKASMHFQVPFLEMKEQESGVSAVESLPESTIPRALKTHVSFRFVRRWLVEDKVKTILTTRNPKDTLVSHFHFYQNIPGLDFQDSWSGFFDHFVKGDQLMYGDQYDWYLDWHKNKGKGEVLVLKYEDMKQDIVREINNIQAFLGIKLSESHVQKIVREADFSQMKSDYPKMVAKEQLPNYALKDASTFVRKGVCGEWKKYFTVEQNEWFDKKYKKLYEELDIDVHYE